MKFMRSSLGSFFLSICFFILALTVPPVTLSALPLEPVDVQYLEVTGNKEVPFEWTRTVQRDGTVKIILTEGQRRFVNICKDSGETLKWEFYNGDQEALNAWREGDFLYVAGVKNGEPVELKKKIDQRPWYQPLSYSLRDFLKSDDEKVSFWTIRSNTLDIYAMEATKKDRQTIDTVSGSELAQVVEIRVKGFLSKFWHCTYWYRLSDGLFLKYQAAHGPVGTAKTTVQVTSVNQVGR